MAEDQQARAGKPTETGVTEPEKSARPGEGRTVALVLGSGGARGYAHIGVIEVLEERGYEIVAISGCSMGALIGGRHAAGKLQEYKDWVTGLGQFDLIRLLDLSLASPGAIRGEKIFSVLHDMIGDVRIEDLPLAYTAVATDLLAHKEIWFQEGPLLQAIRASVAIPSVFTPVLFNGRVLVDGGVIDPLPIMPTVAAHADMIIAVNLAGDQLEETTPEVGRQEPDDQSAGSGQSTSASQQLEQAGEGEVDPAHDSESDDEEWLERIKRRAAKWFDWDSQRTIEDAPSEEHALARADRQHDSEERDVARPISLQDLGIGKFDVMNLTLETLQSSLTRYKIAGYPPDVLIDIPKHVCRTFDYHKAPELINLGRRLANETLGRFESGRAREGST